MAEYDFTSKDSSVFLIHLTSSQGDADAREAKINGNKVMQNEFEDKWAKAK